MKSLASTVMTPLEAAVFGSFDGLPIHALVNHAAVVLVPLAALVGIAFLRPSWRMPLRWPLVIVAVLATASFALDMGKRSVIALSPAVS